MWLRGRDADWWDVRTRITVGRPPEPLILTTDGIRKFGDLCTIMEVILPNCVEDTREQRLMSGCHPISHTTFNKWRRRSSHSVDFQL